MDIAETMQEIGSMLQLIGKAWLIIVTVPCCILIMAIYLRMHKR